MTLPAAATKLNMDAATDDPKLARAEVADLVDKFNSLLTVLGDIVEADAGDGIAVSGANLIVDLANDPGLEITSTKLRVKAGSGIKRTSSGTELDITGLTLETVLDGTNDTIPVYDASALLNRKYAMKDIGKVTDINALTVDNSPDGAADYVMSYDNSASANKKILLSKISGGLVLIASATASASSSIAFTSGIDSTYEMFMVDIVGYDPSAIGALNLTISTDAGSSYLSTGYVAALRGFKSDGNSNNTTGVTSSWPIFKTVEQIEKAFTRVMLPRLSFAEAHHYSSAGSVDSSAGLHSREEGSGYQAGTTAINAIKFTPASGTITSGEFRLYGVQK